MSGPVSDDSIQVGLSERQQRENLIRLAFDVVRRHDPHHGSDHFPVVAELSVERRRTGL